MQRSLDALIAEQREFLRESREPLGLEPPGLYVERPGA
jgi:hypothetical protein